MNYTANMGLRKPEGGEYYSIEDFNANVDMLDGAVSAKANKPAIIVPGNLATVGAGGNLEDSGKNAADFAALDHNHDVAYAPATHASDESVHVSAEEKTVIAVVGGKADKSYVDSFFESGTFLPTLAGYTYGKTAKDPIVKYKGQTGCYRVIGGLCFVTVLIVAQILEVGKSDYIAVGNLPFKPSVVSFGNGAIYTKIYNNPNPHALAIVPVAMVDSEGTPRIVLHWQNTCSPGTYAITPPDEFISVQVSVCYPIA